MRVELLDPPAYSPAYDHALAGALARAGAEVSLITSEFDHGPVPAPDGYRRQVRFYRRAVGAAGSRVRRTSKALGYVPELLAWRRGLAARADVAHLQWLLAPALDLRLLPAGVPTVLTIHDPLLRGAGRRGARALLGPGAFARVDAVVVHSQYARAAVIAEHRLDPDRVAVIRHGALSPATGAGAAAAGAAAAGTAADRIAAPTGLPAELGAVGDDVPVVLSFGLIRPYKGLELLLGAWQTPDLAGAELWVVGRPFGDLAPLRATAAAGVRFVPRFVTAAEQAAVFARADLVVLPYQRSERFGFSGVLATALGAGKAIVVSDVGGLAEVGALGAARTFPAGDLTALRAALVELTGDRAARARLERAATSAAREQFSWDAAARATLALYRRLGA